MVLSVSTLNAVLFGTNLFSILTTLSSVVGTSILIVILFKLNLIGEVLFPQPPKPEPEDPEEPKPEPEPEPLIKDPVTFTIVSVTILAAMLIIITGIAIFGFNINNLTTGIMFLLTAIATSASSVLITGRIIGFI